MSDGYKNIHFQGCAVCAVVDLQVRHRVPTLDLELARYIGVFRALWYVQHVFEPQGQAVHLHVSFSYGGEAWWHLHGDFEHIDRGKI
jgi:hypothetical protein